MAGETENLRDQWVFDLRQTSVEGLPFLLEQLPHSGNSEPETAFSDQSAVKKKGLRRQEPCPNPTWTSMRIMKSESANVSPVSQAFDTVV